MYSAFVKYDLTFCFYKIWHSALHLGSSIKECSFLFNWCSDPILNILTPINEVNPGGFCSNVSKSNETGLLLHESSSFEIKSLSCGIKRNGPMPLSPENEKE